MTTRLKGVTVLFDHNMREDDAEGVIAALRMVKFVTDVRPIEADGSNDWMMYERGQQAWRDAIFAVLRDFSTNHGDGIKALIDAQKRKLE